MNEPSMCGKTIQLTAKPLHGRILAAALTIADRCFPHPDDRAFLRSHWSRVLEGQITYHCPDDNAELTLLEHFVYCIGPEIVAFSGLYRHNQNREREWLNWFGVDPIHRGNGFGRQVIEHTAAIARGRGARTLVGYTEDTPENRPTMRFYESLAFVPRSLYEFRGQAVRLYERTFM